MTNNKTIVRDSNIEWLRIVCMLMIVAGHSVTHGGFDKFPYSVNGIFALVLTQGARIAVDVFIFITGYFSVGKKVSFNKIRVFYIQVWTYSVLTAAALMFSGLIPISLKSLLKAVTPFASSQWWFATCYLLLLLVSPALQLFIRYAEQRIFKLTLLVLFLCWSVLPQLHLGSPGFSLFGWFVFLYLLAAYLRLYPITFLDRLNAYHACCMFLFICTATVMTYFVGGVNPCFYGKMPDFYTVKLI